MLPPNTNDEIFFNREISLWWPKWDTKPNQNFTYILKHLADMDLAIHHCKQKRICVQAGGHVGMWPMRLSQHFEHVYTFEAEPSLADCLVRNTAAFENIMAEPCALSSYTGQQHIQRSGSSGSNRIKPEGTEIICNTLDAFNLPGCDVLFLDVEHHELDVLKGAANTIHQYNPVIQVEELDDGNDVKAFLQNLGYKRISKQGKDAIYIRG